MAGLSERNWPHLVCALGRAPGRLARLRAWPWQPCCSLPWPSFSLSFAQSNIYLLPKACYRSGSTAGGTPQRSWVRSPSGANFSSGVKKTPSLVPRPKHCGARPNSQGDGPPCTGGAGVRGFSWPAVRRSFYLSNNAVGAVSPPAGQVFFYSEPI